MSLLGLRGATNYVLSLTSTYYFTGTNGDIMLVINVIITQITIIGFGFLLNPIVYCAKLTSSGFEEIRADPIGNSGIIGKIKVKIALFHENKLKAIFHEGLLDKGTLNIILDNETESNKQIGGQRKIDIFELNHW